MNYLDLFSGIGGFRLGLEKAGFKFDWEGHSEIDKYANQIYRNHFQDSKELDDVKTVDVGGLPKINLITFGFPCQDLSIAGKRAGMQEGVTRSGLFYEAMRIVRSARPDYFIFENVKGLFSSNDGKDWIAVLREVAESGYDGQWQLLNTRWFLPQNRERVYFVGHIRGQCRPEVFPIGESNPINANRGNKKSTRGQGFSTIDSRYGSRWATETYVGLSKIGQVGEHDNMGQRVYDPKGISTSIRSHGGGQGAKTGLYMISSTQKHATKTIDESPTLPGAMGEGGGHIPMLLGTRIRRLTPTECCRLQGFPDDWVDGISDSQKYKCLGNAVSVPVVKAVVERLRKGGNNGREIL